MLRIGLLAAVASFAMASGAEARDLLGVSCTTPALARCDGTACVPALAERGSATETKSGRKYFLDYPCDLKPNEKVVLILNLHGAGSIGNWQRHYFPAVDYVNKYRLVVATPTAATESAMIPGQPAVRRWDPAADDQFLQDVTDQVIGGIGRRNIKAFWIAGHSQGGITGRRIVCSDFFRDKVDGFLSLSGGRIGNATMNPRFGPPLADGSPPPPREFPAAMTNPPMPACSFSHIFETGEHEITALPATSPWAERYGCTARRQEKDIVDTTPGHVWDYQRAGYNVWGMQARPGTAHEWVWTGCKGGVLVADVERLDKGHTEGLEPRVTEELVRLMASAPGGKLARGS